MTQNDFVIKHRDHIKPFSRFANYGVQSHTLHKDKVLDYLDMLILKFPDMMIYAVYELSGEMKLTIDLPSLFDKEFSYYRKMIKIKQLEEQLNAFIHA
jgi:hypothetical protein